MIIYSPTGAVTDTWSVGLLQLARFMSLVEAASWVNWLASCKDLPGAANVLRAHNMALDSYDSCIIVLRNK